jgi:hypothetical protein
VATPSSAEVALPLTAALVWLETALLVPVWLEVFSLPDTSAEAAEASVAAARKETPAAAAMRRIDFIGLNPFLFSIALLKVVGHGSGSGSFMTSVATASSLSRALLGLAGPIQGVPFEVELEELTVLLLVMAELLDVLLPVDSDRRLHRTVARYQPSPDSSSVTHAGSASPGLVCWGAASA